MFVTVEGVEGAGKSTLLNLLARELERRGIAFLRTREPGGCGLGASLRPLLLDVSSRLDSRAELISRYEGSIDKAGGNADWDWSLYRDERGEWVLCDRYADSTIAYQGYGRGMDIDRLQTLNDYATKGLWPDRTLLLDLPVETGLDRARTRNGREGLSASEGRFEAEEKAFHQRIREGFLDRAARWPERFQILDATLAPQQLLGQALSGLGIAF